jgi:hypothetical protein
MADLPELRSDRLPQPPGSPRPLYDHPHTFGVAHDLERMRQGLAPPPRVPRIQTRGHRPGGGPRARFRRWLADGDRRPVDVWHRIRCRTGHHDVRGGQQIQLGSRFVHVERRCIWCDASPPV